MWYVNVSRESLDETSLPIQVASLDYQSHRNGTGTLGLGEPKEYGNTWSSILKKVKMCGEETPKYETTTHTSSTKIVFYLKSTSHHLFQKEREVRKRKRPPQTIVKHPETNAEKDRIRDFIVLLRSFRVRLRVFEVLKRSWGISMYRQSKYRRHNSRLVRFVVLNASPCSWFVDTMVRCWNILNRSIELKGSEPAILINRNSINGF